MRAPRAETNAMAARPEPSPTTAPSRTRPRAYDASATSGSSVVAALRAWPRHKDTAERRRRPDRFGWAKHRRRFKNLRGVLERQKGLEAKNMLTMLLPTILLLTLVVSPLVWRIRADRRRDRADILR